MLKTTQRYPIVGISVYQLRGRKLFLSDTRVQPLSVMSHHHWQGRWPSRKAQTPLKTIDGIVNLWRSCCFFGGGFILNIFVCSQLEGDNIGWIKRDLVRTNGTASQPASPRANTAILCVFLRLIHVYLRAKLGGRFGDRGWWLWVG